MSDEEILTRGKESITLSKPEKEGKPGNDIYERKNLKGSVVRKKRRE